MGRRKGVMKTGPVNRFDGALMPTMGDLPLRAELPSWISGLAPVLQDVERRGSREASWLDLPAPVERTKNEESIVQGMGR